jgi:hypothetical protein
VANPRREPGKYGRLPFDPERPHLILEKYLDPRNPLSRAGLPPVPLSQDVDRASEVTDWPMYLNDTLGDCTIAGEGHMFGALSRYGLGTEAIFSDAVIQATYSRVGGYVPGDPSTDQGCMMIDVLADAKANGITDTAGHVHKVAGSARLGNPANELLLGQVLDVFGSAYVGINCQASIQTEFADNEPFTWTRGEPIEGGHCIVLQRRRPASTVGGGVLDYVTWGALASATVGFQAHAAEEVWAVVTEDWLKTNGFSVSGMNLAQLLSDMADV